jgi:hypothetical protein
LDGGDDDVLMDGGTFDFGIEGEGDDDSGVVVPPIAAALQTRSSADDDEDENVVPAARMTCGEVVGKCINLVKIVQSDQTGLRLVYSIMTRLADCFRTGNVLTVSIEHVPRDEVRALTTVAPNGADFKRKRSAQENRRNKRQPNRAGRSILEDITDTNAVPPPCTRTRSCRLCRQGGHGRFTCPLLLEYGTPLPDQDSTARMQLQNELTRDTAFETTFQHKSPEALYDKLPHIGVGAVVLHERIDHENKAYVKVTVLDGMGNKIPLLRWRHDIGGGGVYFRRKKQVQSCSQSNATSACTITVRHESAGFESAEPRFSTPAQFQQSI